MRLYYTLYPEPMMRNMCCHLRDVWNLSQKAAELALHQGIKHTKIEQIKQLLKDTTPPPRGQIYCLCKTQLKTCHWVSLTPDRYIDDLYCMRTLDYKLARTIPRCLDCPEKLFGKEYSSTSTRVQKFHFVQFATRLATHRPNEADEGSSANGVGLSGNRGNDDMWQGVAQAQGPRAIVKETTRLHGLRF